MSKAMIPLVLVGIVAILGIVFSFSVISPLSATTQPTKQAGFSDLVANQYFCTQFKEAGAVEWGEETCKKNVITNSGLNHTKQLLGLGISSNAVKYLALGNGTAPTISSTTLNGEIAECGLTRATGTYYDLGNGWWEVNNTFTYSCGSSMIVNTTANFNNTATGTMYAGGTISTVTFTQNGDQLRLRHNFTFVEG